MSFHRREGDRGGGQCEDPEPGSGFPGRSLSDTDDRSDREILGVATSWLEDGLPHGSAVMLPDGRIFGRVLDSSGRFFPFESVAAVGDDLLYWFANPAAAIPDYAGRTAQAFGEGGVLERHAPKVDSNLAADMRFR